MFLVRVCDTSGAASLLRRIMEYSLPVPAGLAEPKKMFVHVCLRLLAFVCTGLVAPCG